MLTKILAAIAALHLSGTALAGVDPLLAAAKLRQYCKACHAVGALKFIQSDDDREMWNSLFANRAPKSGKVWAQGIAEVLQWPAETAPPFDQIMDPSGNRDWMPKGAKRLDFATDFIGATSVRRLILQALTEHLNGEDY